MMAGRLVGMRCAVAAVTVLIVGCVVIGVSPIAALAATTSQDIVGPAGSGTFGANVLVLSNGNYVVVDSHFDSSPTQVDVGAVYLYNGATNQLISTVTGSTTNDLVGSGGLTEVGTSNFVIVSSSWDSGAVVDAGAATWVNGATGLNGQVTALNSLVGTTNNDNVGLDGVTALTNGNYVVDSSLWDNGAPVAADAGAVTLGNGTTGLPMGPVTAGNSLVGTTALDSVGLDGVTALTNGNYVVDSSLWDGATANVGAVTFGNGTSGLPMGPVTAGNSLVGTTANDNVGFDGVTALTNGNYVVASSLWDAAVADAGAATFGNGTTGLPVGPVTAGNSLVGSTAVDSVGSDGVTALTNGNYVVDSSSWNNGGVSAVGAVTLGNGATGLPIGPVTVGNSLIGTTANDNVGSGGVTALNNGSYVVDSPFWTDGAVTPAVLEAGAVTLGTTATPLANVAVSSGNSLVGSSALDNVGSGTDTFGSGGVTKLTNGNYVVDSPLWDSATAVSNVGAVTFVDTSTGLPTGPVLSGNSIVGTTANDKVGLDGVTALTNNNYVVDSSLWDKVTAPTAADAGAVTWGVGTGPTSLSVGSGNSLFGTSANDNVGGDGVTALTNGNYVVDSSSWSNLAPATAGAGAVTMLNGAARSIGPVNAVNSLVGSSDLDNVGSGGITKLANGDYAVVSPFWDHGVTVDSGAVTYGPPLVGIAGSINSTNSALGTPPGVVLSASKRFTTDLAIVVSTSQNRVLLLQIGPDVTPPTIGAAPGDITVSGAPGATTQVVTFTAPTATDNRGTPTVVCVPPSGTSFPIGVTTVTCTATDGAGLTASTSFTVTVTATAGPVPSATPDYVALTPARLADTRPGEPTSDTLFAGGGIQSRGSTLVLPVAGRGGVASDATAVALNVTAVDPVGDGFVTVYPCGSAQPTASNVNYTTGAVIPNSVVAKIGTGGTVCIFVSEATHLVVDVDGYFPATTTLQSINPARVLETRAGLPTIDGLQQGNGLRAASSTTTVQITNRVSVPADATAVVLNITITEAQAPGFATVFPCGTAIPTASNINYLAGSTVANLVVSKIGASGDVCIYTESATHLIADVDGYFPAATSYQALVPARLLETRPAEPTFDGQFQGADLLPAGTVTALTVTGRGGVPSGAATVVLNVTVTEPTVPGFITVYPCGVTRPLASNLNYDVGTTAANAVIVKVGTSGQVCLFNSNPTQLVADVNGYLLN